MKEITIVSDFDGTITKEDGLYNFIERYAKGNWQKVEQAWVNGEISSKECLIREFKLVPDLSEELIADFVKSVEIDEYFKDFYQTITEKNIDFYIVSDGIDYFIDKILHQNGLDNVKVISNHGYFRGEFFEITFPNDFSECKNNSGTCKCNVLSSLRKNYRKIIYIGDGVSDFCVAHKADILYAKSKLAEYCKNEKINYIKYSSFNDIIPSMSKYILS